MSRRLHLGLAALSVALSSTAGAATLRNHVSLHGGTVHLSDLFDGLQPGQDCDLGPAPAPGRRLVLPPTQVAAIASEFGVDWQPTSIVVVLERPSRLVKREEILAVLRPALTASGAPADSEIELGAFASPALPVETTAAPEVQTIDLDPQSGRFSATLLLAPPDADPISLRVTGRAQQQESVLALSHALPAGATIGPTDLQTIRVRGAGPHGTLVTNAADVTGLTLRQPVAGGTPLTREILARPVQIGRGRPVVLRLDADGLSLTAAGTALESGAIGDRIRVVNSLSHAVLVGEITGSAEIRIEPGTAPTMQPTGPQRGLPQLAGTGYGSGESWNNPAQEAQFP